MVVIDLLETDFTRRTHDEQRSLLGVFKTPRGRCSATASTQASVEHREVTSDGTGTSSPGILRLPTTLNEMAVSWGGCPPSGAAAHPGAPLASRGSGLDPVFGRATTGASTVAPWWVAEGVSWGIGGDLRRVRLERRVMNPADELHYEHDACPRRLENQCKSLRRSNTQI